MKKYVLLTILVLTTMLSNIHIQAASPKDQATWLWNPRVLLDDEADMLAALVNKKVNKLYLQVDQQLPVQVYRDFINKARMKGIRVYALDGGAEWLAPGGYAERDQLMKWLKTYQYAAKPSERFAGVHLDVEPYLYGGWTKNRAVAVQAYQTLLVEAKNQATAMKLPIEADIPFWFDEILYNNQYGKGNLAEWVIAKLDGVTIMAYRDTAKLIIDFSKQELALAKKYRKPAVIAVEAGKTEEGDAVSFFEEGSAYMQQQLTVVQKYYAGNTSFQGTAVHDIYNWCRLP